MTAENQIFVTFKKFLKKLPKDQTRGGNYVCVLAWLVLFEILRVRIYIYFSILLFLGWTCSEGLPCHMRDHCGLVVPFPP